MEQHLLSRSKMLAALNQKDKNYAALDKKFAALEPNLTILAKENEDLKDRVAGLSITLNKMLIATCYYLHCLLLSTCYLFLPTLLADTGRSASDYLQFTLYLLYCLLLTTYYLL